MFEGKLKRLDRYWVSKRRFVVQCMSVEFVVSISLVFVLTQMFNVPTVFSRSVSQYTIVMNGLIRRLSVRHSDTERLNGVSSLSVRVL